MKTYKPWDHYKGWEKLKPVGTKNDSNRPVKEYWLKKWDLAVCLEDESGIIKPWTVVKLLDENDSAPFCEYWKEAACMYVYELAKLPNKEKKEEPIMLNPMSAKWLIESAIRRLKDGEKRLATDTN